MGQMRTPPIVERYHSIIVALDRLLGEEIHYYYTHDEQNNPHTQSKINIFNRSALILFERASEDYPNLDEFETDKYVDSLTSGWFG